MNKKMRLPSIRLMRAGLIAVLLLCFFASTEAKRIVMAKTKIMIIDGQNNHDNWPQTSSMMKGYLEETGSFSVDIVTSPPEDSSMADFKPDFSAYKAVVLNYNGDAWPESTKRAFEEFVQNGGGVVSVHAADNAFPDWPEYNKMIGLGGWGDRDEKSGPYVYYDSKGHVVVDSSAGVGGSHGAYAAFQVLMRVKDHPITRGLPTIWMHDKDELYNRLRGPAQNMEILATAYSDPAKGGTGRHEPMLMVISYGKGKVFHLPMGHGMESQKCIGFITCLQRGTQWVSGLRVERRVPYAFPTPDKVSGRPN